LATTVQNVAARVIGHLGFVHHYAIWYFLATTSCTYNSSIHILAHTTHNEHKAKMDKSETKGRNKRKHK
jgi:hypothetical protein